MYKFSRFQINTLFQNFNFKWQQDFLIYSVQLLNMNKLIKFSNFHSGIIYNIWIRQKVSGITF